MGLSGVIFGFIVVYLYKFSTAESLRYFGVRMPGYEGTSAGVLRDIRARVRGYWYRGTSVGMLGYECWGMSAGYECCRGTRVLVLSGYEGISAGIRGYEGISAGVRGYEGARVIVPGTRVRGYEVAGCEGNSAGVRGYEGTRVRRY